MKTSKDFDKAKEYDYYKTVATNDESTERTTIRSMFMSNKFYKPNTKKEEEPNSHNSIKLIENRLKQINNQFDVLDHENLTAEQVMRARVKYDKAMLMDRGSSPLNKVHNNKRVEVKRMEHSRYRSLNNV